MYRAELNNNHFALATISSTMRKRWVRLTVGERTHITMSLFDSRKAQIVWRLR